MHCFFCVLINGGFESDVLLAFCPCLIIGGFRSEVLLVLCPCVLLTGGIEPKGLLDLGSDVLIKGGIEPEVILDLGGGFWGFCCFFTLGCSSLSLICCLVFNELGVVHLLLAKLCGLVLLSEIAAVEAELGLCWRRFTRSPISLGWDRLARDRAPAASTADAVEEVGGADSPE